MCLSPQVAMTKITKFQVKEGSVHIRGIIIPSAVTQRLLQSLIEQVVQTSPEPQ